MKTCNVCGKAQPEVQFYPNRAKCVSCYRHESERSDPLKLAGTLHRSQVQSSTDRGHPPVSYSKDDLHKWLISHPDFRDMWDVWVASGYQSNLKPSVDRVDESLGYSLQNIQLVTWNENRGKTRQLDKYKAVSAYNLDGTFHSTYESLRQASDAVGRCKSDISKAANGIRKTCAKLKWKWE